MPRMRALILAIPIALCAALPTQVALAADTEIPPSRVEITLFGGYRFGGSGAVEESIPVTVGGETTNSLFEVDLEKAASYGIALNWEAETDSFYELAYSRQSSTLDASIPLDVTVEYLQIGGYYMVGVPTAKVVPYFLLTVGGGRLTPDDADLRDTTKFAMAIGGGVKVTFTEHIGMRIDGRLYGLFLDADNLFCASDDGVGCKIHLEGDMLVQPEVSLGLIIGF